jgi:hypothetical protein
LFEKRRLILANRVPINLAGAGFAQRQGAIGFASLSPFASGRFHTTGESGRLIIVRGDYLISMSDHLELKDARRGEFV